MDDAFEIENEQYRQKLKEWQEKYKDEIVCSPNKDKIAGDSEKESSEADR